MRPSATRLKNFAKIGLEGMMRTLALLTWEIAARAEERPVEAGAKENVLLSARPMHLFPG